MLDEVFDPFSLYNYCSPDLGEHFFAGVAQLVEQLIRNQQVSGSSPLAGFLKTKIVKPSFKWTFLLWGNQKTSLLIHWRLDRRKNGLCFVERRAEFFENVIVSGVRQVVNPNRQRHRR